MTRDDLEMVRQALKDVVDDVCGALCPSVWKTAKRRPPCHPKCVALRAALSRLEAQPEIPESLVDSFHRRYAAWKESGEIPESAGEHPTPPVDPHRQCCFCGADNSMNPPGYAGERGCQKCGKGGHGEPDEPGMAYMRQDGVHPTPPVECPKRAFLEICVVDREMAFVCGASGWVIGSMIEEIDRDLQGEPDGIDELTKGLPEGTVTIWVSAEWIEPEYDHTDSGHRMALAGYWDLNRVSAPCSPCPGCANLRAICADVRAVFGARGCACIKDLPGEGYTCAAHERLFRYAAEADA